MPDIGSLLGREIAAAPKLDGRTYQQRLILAMVDLFRELAEPVLLLEDLQWVRESLAVLQQMLRVSEQLPGVMVLGTYRHDERPQLPEELPGAQTLILARLDEAEVAQLSQAMLGAGGSTPHIVSLLTQETEGNTFFMVEVMHALAEEAGQLAEIGQMTLPSGIFTSGMDRLLQRRIQKVAAADQPLLQLAAVAGRQLDLAALRVLAPDTNITDWLQRVADTAVLSVQDDQWVFAHDKLRAAILVDLDDAKRQGLHRRVAEGLEQVYPEDENYHETLLEHWYQAGNLDREIHYLAPVAEQLLEISADYERARAILERSLQSLPEGDVRQLSIWNGLAQSHWRLGSYAQAQELAQQAGELATQVDDQLGLATSLNHLGRLARDQGDYGQAHDYLLQSLAIRQTIGDQRGIANSLNNLGLVARIQGNYEQAQEYYQQSLTIKQAIGDQSGIALNLNNLGMVAYDQGDYAQAQEYYQQSLVIR